MTDPKLYFCDPDRTINFVRSESTPGVKGLCFAVLLQALEDGCCRDWILDIVDAYDIDVPHSMFDKAPVRNLVLDPETETYVDASKLTRVKRRVRKFKALWLEGIQINLIPHKKTHEIPPWKPTLESTTEAPEPSESSEKME